MGMSLSKLRELVMDREAWRAEIHGVSKSQTRLSDWTDWLTECILDCIFKVILIQVLQTDYSSFFPPLLHSRFSLVIYFIPACKVASVVFNFLWPYGLCPSRLLCPWGSPGKNTGVGCHGLLQGIFPTQGSNPHLLNLLHWQVGSLPLASSGKPILYLNSVYMSNPIFQFILPSFSHLGVHTFVFYVCLSLF